MIAGAPDDVFLQDQGDDGEPRGTAGKPMLNVLQHSGLGHVLVVVTRYFGGIKLGSGGLVRAYTRSVSEALVALQTEVRLQRRTVTVQLPYTLLASAQHWLNENDIVEADAQFADDVCLTLLVPEKKLDALSEYLRALSGGEVDWMSG